MPLSSKQNETHQAQTGEWSLTSVDFARHWWGDAAGAWGLPLAQLLASWQDAAAAPDAPIGAHGALPQALNQLKPRSRLATWPHQFVPQSALPKGQAYEQFIFDKEHIPTRDGWHDAFNGLVWTRFAATKQRLNALQAAQIATLGIGKARGPARDGLTLFDENAVLLQAPPPLWDALLARDWQRLFIDLRPLWQDAQVLIFGHALLEKLINPYKAITAHVLTVPVPMQLPRWVDASCTVDASACKTERLAVDASTSEAARLAVDAAWDDWLSSTLTADLLAQKPYTPLPVMGIPTWSPDNGLPQPAGGVAPANPAFYADPQVFRLAARAPAIPQMP